jgi:molybdopterin-biosynthesis enzyme MoeA-like protein
MKQSIKPVTVIVNGGAGQGHDDRAADACAASCARPAWMPNWCWQRTARK